MPAQGDGVLAGHQRDVAGIVGCRAGGIAGGIDRRMPADLEVRVHQQTALGIPRCGDLLGQVTGAEAHGPDHRVRLDPLTIGQLHTAGVDRGDRVAQAPFDAQLGRRRGDRRADAIAQRGSDLRAPVDHHHLDRRVSPQYGPEPVRHFRGRLDAGEATARHDHRVARRRCRLPGEPFEMPLQAHRLLDLVDVEGVLVNARQ
ncbi:hypothetical protein FQZ97_644050 [compost metagenome]